MLNLWERQEIDAPIYFALKSFKMHFPVNIIDPLNIGLTLRPGIIYFFKDENSSTAEWQEYEQRMRTSALRRNFGFETVEPPVSMLSGYTAARRYNIGNLVTEAYVWVAGNHGATYSRSAIEEMLDTLCDIDAWETGSREILPEIDYNDLRFSVQAREDYALEESDAQGGYVSSFRRKFPFFGGRTKHEAERYEPDDDEKEGDEMLHRMEAERIRMMDMISQMIKQYVYQFHEMPPVNDLLCKLGGKYLLVPNAEKTYSSVIVNGNLDIILPAYNEMRLELTPLAKILYILFLLHPEGIRLKDMDEYESTLVEIYSLVKPGGDDDRALRSIKDMCRPGSESLNQKLSMIRRAVKVKLAMPELVAYYSIGGPRGGLQRLPAAAECTMPSILGMGLQ